MRCFCPGVEVAVVEPCEDVRRKRGSARARRTQLVLDRFGEQRHGRAGNDERRNRCHCLLDGPDRPSHRLQLLGRLHPAELVHDRRARPEAVEAENSTEVQCCFGPYSVPDRDGAG